MRSTDARVPILNHPAPTTAAHRSLSPVPSGLSPGKDRGERCRGCRDFAPCPCLEGAQAIGPASTQPLAGPDRPPPSLSSRRATSPVSRRWQEKWEDDGGKEISSRNPTPRFRFHLFSWRASELVNNRCQPA